MLQKAGVLHILTCKCASRHSGVPFLNILTSKSGPSMWCFVHFDWQMCFAPQQRAIFRHQNFKKWSAIVVFCFDLQMCFSPQRRAIFADRNFKNGSRTEVLCAFWHANALHATAACNISTSELQKAVRDCGVLCILTCKCAFRQSGVPFFTCLLNRYLRTRRFSEATFRTSATTNHWKNTAIRDVANISRTVTCLSSDSTRLLMN